MLRLMRPMEMEMSTYKGRRVLEPVNGTPARQLALRLNEPRKPQAKYEREPSDDVIFYWAYGSNLSHDWMKFRCPGAKPVKALYMPNAALVFRRTADVVLREGAPDVPGGLWEIRAEHQRRLDRVEGHPNFYERKTFKIGKAGVWQRDCIYYRMIDIPDHDGIQPPKDIYVGKIWRGYHDFGLPLEYLDRALQEAWDTKSPTEYLRRRSRKSSGKLARTIQALSGLDNEELFDIV